MKVAQQARTIDVLPTILDLMKGKPPTACQGTLTPAFAGKDVPTTFSYEETLYPKINMGWAELRGVRTTRWKYVRAPKPELYDLLNDPGEKSNVIDSHRTEFQSLNRNWKRSPRRERAATRRFQRVRWMRVLWINSSLWGISQERHRASLS